MHGQWAKPCLPDGGHFELFPCDARALPSPSPPWPSRNSVPVKKRWRGHFGTAAQECSRAHCLCVWSRTTYARHTAQYSKGESNIGPPVSFGEQDTNSRPPKYPLEPRE